ncbi:uncharacterized protein LOC113467161 [Diaphorina citri]|uniref:Uncharacterized protein LOC113467161 n=1 Tax=Diaphorina citri TaxID=121845 RepID=A0A3Q0IWG4_DIACI|nr:uncharacterized protein LOC113467161 [Diaphorina citri]
MRHATPGDGGRSTTLLSTLDGRASELSDGSLSTKVPGAALKAVVANASNVKDALGETSGVSLSTEPSAVAFNEVSAKLPKTNVGELVANGDLDNSSFKDT